MTGRYSDIPLEQQIELVSKLNQYCLKVHKIHIRLEFTQTFIQKGLFHTWNYCMLQYMKYHVNYLQNVLQRKALIKILKMVYAGCPQNNFSISKEHPGQTVRVN